MDILDEPNSSWGAMVVFVLLILAIILSVVVLCVQTLEQYEDDQAEAKRHQARRYHAAGVGAVSGAAPSSGMSSRAFAELRRGRPKIVLSRSKVFFGKKGKGEKPSGARADPPRAAVATTQRTTTSYEAQNSTPREYTVECAPSYVLVLSLRLRTRVFLESFL